MLVLTEQEESFLRGHLLEIPSSNCLSPLKSSQQLEVAGDRRIHDCDPGLTTGPL